jgi:integrase/recombinase XerC
MTAAHRPSDWAEQVIEGLTSDRPASSTLIHRTTRIRWFGSFLDARGVCDLDAVGHDTVRAFLDSRRAFGAMPTPSEVHGRLASVRLLYKEARRLGLASSDPTLDIELPPRRPTSARPLTDGEVERGRSYAVQRTDLRPAVCWALAEATAWTSEMPLVRTSHLDLDLGTVHLPGGSARDPRVGRLTPWGIGQLRRRLERLDPDEGSDPVLMGEGRWDDPDEGRAAATMALDAVLRSARLKAHGVNPRSIPAWAGAVALTGGASIDEVAQMLGVRSLDQAAGIVGFQWRGGSAP